MSRLVCSFDASYCAAMVCRNLVVFRYILRYPQSYNFFKKDKTVVLVFAFGSLLNFFVIFYFCYIFLSHGNIEVNPGSNKNCSTGFYFCHWSLNSLTAQNYVKLSWFQGLKSAYKHDEICLSETYLDNWVLSDKSDLDFQCSHMVRADYPGNVKRGGVCIYFKESWSLRFWGFPSYLDQCLLCELSCKNKKCFIATLYCLSSQSREDSWGFNKNNIQSKRRNLKLNHQTGVNMTYLTVKKYKLTPSLQNMVLDNWYVNQPI